MYEDSEIIEQLTDYFSIFNENFLGGLKKLIKMFYEYLLSKKIISSIEDINSLFDSFDKKVTSDKGISLEESIKNVLDFFCSIGPRYGQMASNLLNETKITKGNVNYSYAYNIKISENEFDASVIVHELTHSFVTSKEQSEFISDTPLPEERYSALFYILCEINSYVFQFLYYDYYFDKNGIKLDRDDMLISMLGVADKYRKLKIFDRREPIFRILSQGKAKEHVKEIYDCFYLATLDKNDGQYCFSREMLNYSHSFGMLVACYIYQKILENPENIKMCFALENALSQVGNDASVLQFLEKQGIPCFKDGKISLDDDCVMKLYNTLIDTFDLCLGSRNIKISK